MQKNIWLLKLSAFTLIGTFASLFFWAILTSSSPAIAQNSTVTKENSKIVGRWIIKPSSGQPITFIFTSDGRVFEIRQNQAFEVGKYQYTELTDDKFSVKIDGSVGTLVFMPEGRLVGVNSSNGITGTGIHEKISNEGTIPLGIEIITISTQKNKAMRAEAKTYVGSLNRCQQAFHLERRKLAASLSELTCGIPPETENYSYKINLVDSSRVQNIAIPKKDELPTYIGSVFITKTQSFPEGVALAVLCVSQKLTITPILSIVTISGQAPKCPQGYDNLS